MKGRWRLGEEIIVDTHVRAWSKGIMEEDLFIQTCLSYLNLYPDIAPRFEWEGEKLKKGPVMLKTDSGPGPQCKS